VCQVAEGRSVLKSVAAIGGGEGWRDAVYKSRLYYSTTVLFGWYQSIIVSLYHCISCRMARGIHSGSHSSQHQLWHWNIPNSDPGEDDGGLEEESAEAKKKKQDNT
jgi:hypothetical protein